MTIVKEDERGRNIILETRKINLGNEKQSNIVDCEGFSFKLGQYAFCDDCNAWIPYNIKDGKPIFPEKCKKCWRKLIY